MITLAASASDSTVQIVALVVGLVQTVALAIIADRSRRVRAVDRRTARVEHPDTTGYGSGRPTADES